MPGFLASLVLVLAVFMFGIKSDMSVMKQQLVPAGHLGRTGYIGKYRAFVFYAAQYMAANPNASGTFFWSTISSLGPTGAKNAIMPSDWKVVAVSGSYTICTSFPDLETAAPIVGVFQNSSSLVPVNSTQYVLGNSSNLSSLTASAAQCN